MLTDHVGPHDDKQVAAALRRELLRDGQVLYGTTGPDHRRGCRPGPGAVSEARVAVAHGQMPEEQLESTVQGF